MITDFSDCEISNRNIKDILREELLNIDDISVVQIGAGCGGWERLNMGSQSPHLNDPLWSLLISKPSWKCYLFEPVLSEFLDCVEFYKDNKNITVFNSCAVTHNYSFENIYVRKSKSMSSLMEEHRKKDDYSKIEKVSTVIAVNINNIIQEFDPYLIQIDAEGMDCSLVDSFIKDRTFSPNLISFEWCHSKEEEINDLYKNLLIRGYELIFKSSFDVIFKKK